ncbi:hypothetical protein JOE68_004589 [Saccharothrix algeriensis]|uniref:Uncharacterized protein n=1 Tax=Saccharothrix algeriensis TaxID=173560 RepID=A0ABS2SCP0_9PSEU|nr:hypothetical protein [Saccharothrix algeriensis]
MRGEHDRCFFSFSLAACLSGEDSFKLFSFGRCGTNSYLDRCAILV